MSKRKPWYSLLYVQVLVAILIGVLIGHFFPDAGVKLKPLGDAFISLITMMIAPIVFCNVVHGIASMGDMKKVGRIGVKTLVYFEVASTLALIIGVTAAYVLHPGAGFNLDPSTLDPSAVPDVSGRSAEGGLIEFLLAMIPNTFVGAFTGGEVLPVLLIAIFSGFAISQMKPELRARITTVVGDANKLFFGVIRIVTKAAPLGALGAIAFTVGAYGAVSLWNLVELIMTFYITAAVFIFGVLGVIARLAGFSIFRYLAYIKDEILTVLGTSSSETVMPQMIQKLQRMGAAESTAGLVFPTGYSFNTDGSNIYIPLAALFLAQATNTHLSPTQVMGLVLFAMVTSKGAAGVSGTAFVTLAVTLTVFPAIPIQSLAILLGIDKFMSECRALTNIIGNGVATLVVSRWEKELDPETLRRNLAQPSGETESESEAPELLGAEAATEAKPVR
jgi:aerobic C4-dicarboxylate transport protein